RKSASFFRADFMHIVPHPTSRLSNNPRRPPTSTRLWPLNSNQPNPSEPTPCTLPLHCVRRLRSLCRLHLSCHSLPDRPVRIAQSISNTSLVPPTPPRIFSNATSVLATPAL